MFYNGKKASNLFGKQISQGVGEPDIREEVRRIIVDEKRGGYYIYRRARRDSEGRPMLSPTSRNNRSREANMDIPTSSSETMAYMFDDYPVLGYLNTSSFIEQLQMMPQGDGRSEDKSLILEWDVLYSITGDVTDIPDQHDQIIIPRYDLEGRILSPLRVKELYNITSVEPFRLDGNGRIEYHKLNLVSRSERSHSL